MLRVSNTVRNPTARFDRILGNYQLETPSLLIRIVSGCPSFVTFLLIHIRRERMSAWASRSAVPVAKCLAWVVCRSGPRRLLFDN